MRKICFTVIVFLAAFSSLVHARDLFEITGTTTDLAEPIAVREGDSNFPDLIEKAIRAEDSFQVLEGYGAVNTLTYGGVESAMLFEINATGTQAVLRIPVLDFQRTFAGINRDELYNNIDDFLKNEGSDVYKRFLEAMNRRSLVAVTDGNPSSSTAIMANSIFEDSGFGGYESLARTLDIEGMNLSIMADIAQIKAGNFDGKSYSLPIGFGFGITDRVSAKIRMPLSYREIEGASIYDGSLIVNLPIKLLIPDTTTGADGGGSRWSWTLTPSMGIGAAGSTDYAAGSFLYTLGLTSVLGYDFGAFSLTMGNGISMFNSKSINVDDYDVGGEIDQKILKNGLKVSVPFDRKWVVEAYGIYTQFLEDAALDNYYTVGAQAGMRLRGMGISDDSGLLFFRFSGDIGDDYKSFKVAVGTGFRF